MVILSMYRNAQVLLGVLLAVQLSTGLSSEAITFLDDDIDGPRTVPLDLGAFPHECVGNLEQCPDGMSVSLWYTPGVGDPQLPAEYVLSTGGQSAMSQGWYLRRNYGMEFEVGVSLAETKWVWTFPLKEEQRVNILFTWSQSSGLKLYLDGIVQGAAVSSSSRIYTAPMFDPFLRILVGAANDIVGSLPQHQMDVHKIQQWNRVLMQSDIDSAFDEGAQVLYYQGCVASPSQSSSAAVDISGEDVTNPISQCLQYCAGSGSTVAFLQSKAMCSCWKNTEAQVFFTGLDALALCDSSEWEVFTVGSRDAQLNYPINLKVEIILPTENSYIRQDETVTFTMTTSTQEEVYFSFDFADGHSKVTQDKLVSHSWNEEGTYMVVIKAETRTTSETIYRRINITWVEEGIAPELVILNLSPASTSKMVDVTLATVSAYETSCVMSFGDGQVKNFNFNDYVNQISDTYTYDSPGVYDTKAVCTNHYGTTEAVAKVFVRNLEMEYQTALRSSNIVVPLYGASSNQETVLVLLNEQPISGHMNDSTMWLTADAFPYSAEYYMEIKAENTPLNGRILNLQTAPESLRILSTYDTVQTSESTELTFEIQGGDHLHLLINYGDGNTESLYVPDASGTLSISRTYSYDKLGGYTVSIEVANDVSYEKVTKYISVERPILTASLTAGNVTAVNVYTYLTLTVDMDISPAMPIEVTFNYGDGIEETVKLGMMKDIATPLVHRHTYSDYGIYEVHAIIFNNISSVEARAIHQVGQNITQVDLATNAERLIVGQMVTIEAHSPVGAPITYSFDMGDGTTLVVHKPDDYEPPAALLDVAVTESPLVVVTELGDVEVGTVGDHVEYLTQQSIVEVESGSRRKRDVLSNITDTADVNLGEGNVVGIYTTASPSDTVLLHEAAATAAAPHSSLDRVFIQYQYAQPGTYQVTAQVSNPFGNAETSLCPGIQILPEETVTPECSVFEVSVPTTTESSPVSIMRSEKMKIPVTVKQTCTGGETYSVDYTWKTKWRTTKGEWRPELEVCTTASLEPELVIESNTLWYGTYMFEVTAGARVLNPANRRRRATADGLASSMLTADGNFYLTVTPSPLVAKIQTEKPEISSAEAFSIDVSSSYDPDVIHTNMSGINSNIFCWRDTVNDEFSLYDEETLITKSYKVANNTFDTNSFWDTDCVVMDGGIFVNGYAVAMMGMAVTTEEPIHFKTFITKDSRSASASVKLTVLPNITSENLFDNLDDLLSNPDPGVRLLVIGMANDILNNVADDDNGTDAKTQRGEIRGKIIDALEGVAEDVANYDQLQTTATALGDVTVVKDEVSPDKKATAASALGQAATQAGTLALDAPIDKVTGMGGDMLGVADNIMPFAEEPSDDTGTNYTTVIITTTPFAMTTAQPDEELAPAEPVELPCCIRANGLCEWIEPECDFLDEADRKSFIWDDKFCDEIHPDDMTEIRVRYELYLAMMKKKNNAIKKATTTNAMAAIDGVGSLLLNKQDQGGNITLESPRMRVELNKVGSGNGTMGGIDVPGGITDGEEGVGAMVMDSPNPYTYSDSANSVVGGVKTMTFKSHNGSTISVNNTDEPFVIWMPGQPQLVGAPGNFTFKTSQEILKMNIHNITVPNNDSSLHIQIFPETDDQLYEIFIKYGERPNETYYDHVGYLPNTDYPSTENDYETELLKYTYFPPMNVTALNGTYILAVRLIESKVRLGEVAYRGYSYGYRSLTSGCRYWSDELDTWDTAGCTVGSKTTMYRTECLCNHLTSFGSDFVVPANTIDFSTVFSLANFIEAIPVFCTVGIIMLLYIGLCIWARHMDKKDVLKWGATPLEDNLPSDQYHYQLTVYTGTKKNSGTKSRISFIMSGDDNDSGVRRLFDGKRKEHPTGSIYNYILSVESSLGPLTFLRIWHDNTGTGKQRSWYLDQFQVVDLQTGDRYFFLCDRWLAVEEDDGLVERILPIAGPRELTAFKHLFNSSVRKKLTNDHLWVSVVSRPTRSSFTRVQRISCCIGLLYLTMISNCMFYQGEENMEKKTMLTVGPFSFSLAQLYISVVSTLIVFPPSMIIVTIFRKARPKQNAVMQSNQTLAKKSKKFKWRTLTNDDSQLWDNKPQRSRYQKFKDNMRNMMTMSQQNKYKDDSETGLKRRKKKVLTFPHWTIYIAWALCIGSIIVPAFFTVLYSMEWGREKSLDWLTSFILSFFQSVVVVQPVKVLLLAAFISCIMRKPDMDEEEDMFDDLNNAIAKQDEVMMSERSEKHVAELMAQRKMAVSHLQPPNLEDLEEARQLRMKEIAMEAILKECIVYFFFIVVVFFLSYQTRDLDSFNFADNLKNRFVRGSPSFESSISTPPTIWNYVHNTLIPNLYSGDWYNGKENTWRGKLQISDRQTIRIGVGRMRQLRIKDDTCKIQPAFKNIIKHCRDNYNFFDDDTKDYLTGWEPWTEEGAKRHSFIDCYEDAMDTGNETTLRDEESPWVYRSGFQLASGPYPGLWTIYKGGGYTFTFKRTPDHTLRLLAELEQYEWINQRTRALFIEFTVYNANINLFGSVILLVEYLASGGPITSANVKVFRLNSYVGGWGAVVIFFEALFAGFVLYFLIRECKRIKQQKKKYFYEFWNLLEISTLILSIICIIMYAMKKIAASAAMSTLQESESGEYVNFVTISYWDEVFAFLLATVVFTTTIKFIKLLKFNRRMSMLGDTVRLATQDLKYFVVTFCIYFFAFCMMAMMLFGVHLADYQTFISSAEALFSFALGSFDFQAMRNTSPLMGPLFFFLYVLVVFVILMAMFLTIIADAFSQIKHTASKRSNDYEILDFIIGKARCVFGWGGKNDK